VAEFEVYKSHFGAASNFMKLMVNPRVRQAELLYNTGE